MLLFLFDLRLANKYCYVTNFLQSNTYLQQTKLPAYCDFCGPSAGSICKKGSEAGKYSHYDKVTAWNTSQYWYFIQIDWSLCMAQPITFHFHFDGLAFGLAHQQLPMMLGTANNIVIHIETGWLLDLDSL